MDALWGLQWWPTPCSSICYWNHHSGAYCDHCFDHQIKIKSTSRKRQLKQSATSSSWCVAWLLLFALYSKNRQMVRNPRSLFFGYLLTSITFLIEIYCWFLWHKFVSTNLLGVESFPTLKLVHICEIKELSIQTCLSSFGQMIVSPLEPLLQICLKDAFILSKQNFWTITRRSVHWQTITILFVIGACVICKTSGWQSTWYSCMGMAFHLHIQLPMFLSSTIAIVFNFQYLARVVWHHCEKLDPTMRVGLNECKHLHLFALMMPVWSVVLCILSTFKNKCKLTGLLQSV